MKLARLVLLSVAGLFPASIHAQASTSGTACGGLGMMSTGSPALGQSFDFGVQGGPAGGAAAVLVGLPTTPIDLSILGGNGCFLHLFSPVAMSVSLDGNGAHTIPSMVTTNPSAVGAVLGVQYAAIVPAVNALGVATSDLLTITIQP